MDRGVLARSSADRERRVAVPRVTPGELYVETSVISYLTARPSRDVIALGHQQLTREWWEHASREFELFASRLVVAEAGLGDPAAAAARLEVLEPITLLTETAGSRALARRLLAAGGLPNKAASDALHIAVAAVHGMDYLVTRNCKHIANARMLRFVMATCRAAGFEVPVICTPEELDIGAENATSSPQGIVNRIGPSASPSLLRKANS